MKLTQDVYEETRKAAIAYGVPELALKMGIGNPGVLYNKLNHGDSCSHHKLTLADLIQIITITGNTAPLHALCAVFEHSAYELPKVSASDDALLDMVNNVHIRGGMAHGSMAEALADGRVSEAEFAQFAHDCRHWLAGIIGLKHRFKTLVMVCRDRNP